MDEDDHISDEGGADARPVVRLKPKAGRRFFAGAPWVYQDEVVLDRRTRKIAPGSLAELQDAERRPLGLVAVNLDSGISCRLLDRDPAAEIDLPWMQEKIARALHLRETLFDAPFYRLIHAETDGLPGVIVDRFGSAAVMQPNAAWADARAEMIAEALRTAAGVETVMLNAGSRARGLEGLEGASRLMSGALDGPVEVPMNGAIYLADLLEGQKTGLYFDQRPNHAFVARLCKGARMLDVFSHVGGFALAGLAGGAASALAVDGSEPALALAAEGARRSGFGERFSARRGDAFDTLNELGEAGERFDVVVCDPPAFAPNKGALQNGLRAYARIARLAARVVEPGGFLTLCSCSHAADPAAFRAACVRGIGQAGREAQLLRSGGAGPDHPEHPGLAETSYLKALTFRLDG
ncbi:class I SAM-dependent rRNA methyltransferase [Albimonas sp. CAU 1670]|uniref:RSP_2647 family RNA methyltransferase n=1 Tax=Albimonas sp. CAU 1670 TaxID=3032599 RepID=UPI0023DBA01D|nr:class I SAM-dependent rRNA methyltransferase [Albimonas sp. CAU 1670]MDF2231903.1 class I SAM-dependent rRNA methyltransferase [Albimonas sp. CAU 1670]